MNIWISAMYLGAHNRPEAEPGDVMFRLMTDNNWRMYIRTPYGTWKNQYFPKSWFLA